MVLSTLRKREKDKIVSPRKLENIVTRSIQMGTKAELGSEDFQALLLCNVYMPGG